ncbi:MAG: Ada metal-binding domain-containing protein [Thermomicrobiales bacterium]
MSESGKAWTLVGANAKSFSSAVPGELGGYRPRKIYGRLDCPSALRAIAKGGYVRQRVFFLDEAAAAVAGYRPCAVCLRARYDRWKADPEGFRVSVLGGTGGA